MTSYQCTCADPKEQICMTHKTYKVTPLQYHWMRVTGWWSNAVPRFKWAVAKWWLGELYYYTAFTCPKCGNQYCPAKPEELPHGRG